MCLARLKGWLVLRRLFFMLRTGPGTAVVGGPSMLLPKCPFMPPFAKMPLKQREAILLWWANGPIPLLRKVSAAPEWFPSRAPCPTDLSHCSTCSSQGGRLRFTTQLSSSSAQLGQKSC